MYCGQKEREMKWFRNFIHAHISVEVKKRVQKFMVEKSLVLKYAYYCHELVLNYRVFSSSIFNNFATQRPACQVQILCEDKSSFFLSLHIKYPILSKVKS